MLHQDEGITRLIEHLSSSCHATSSLRETVHDPWLSHLTELTVSRLDTKIDEQVRAVFEGSPLRRLNTITLDSSPDFKE